jgi:hypothetical protein
MSLTTDTAASDALSLGFHAGISSRNGDPHPIALCEQASDPKHHGWAIPRCYRFAISGLYTRTDRVDAASHDASGSRSGRPDDAPAALIRVLSRS